VPQAKPVADIGVASLRCMLCARGDAAFLLTRVCFSARKSVEESRLGDFGFEIGCCEYCLCLDVAGR